MKNNTKATRRANGGVTHETTMKPITFKGRILRGVNFTRRFLEHTERVKARMAELNWPKSRRVDELAQMCLDLMDGKTYVFNA